jgi:hypothetical protein
VHFIINDRLERKKEHFIRLHRAIDQKQTNREMLLTSIIDLLGRQ